MSKQNKLAPTGELEWAKTAVSRLGAAYENSEGHWDIGRFEKIIAESYAESQSLTAAEQHGRMKGCTVWCNRRDGVLVHDPTCPNHKPSPSSQPEAQPEHEIKAEVVHVEEWVVRCTYSDGSTKDAFSFKTQEGAQKKLDHLRNIKIVAPAPPNGGSHGK